MSNSTRDTLELFRQQGFNLSQTMKIDFFIVLPDLESGKMIVDRILNEGFKASLELDSEDGSCTCYCSMDLIPEYSTIVAIENKLNSIAKGVGGFIDGFGTYGN
mgnify:CR=1 FL=1